MPSCSPTSSTAWRSTGRWPTCMRAQRDLTADVLAFGTGEVETRLAAWHEARPEAIDRAIASVQDLTEGDMTVSRLSVAAGLLSDLARSA